MSKSPISEVNPFFEIDWDRRRIESLENRVEVLQNQLEGLMESITLLMRVENFRVEKIMKK